MVSIYVYYQKPAKFDFLIEFVLARCCPRTSLRPSYSNVIHQRLAALALIINCSRNPCLGPCSPSLSRSNQPVITPPLELHKCYNIIQNAPHFYYCPFACGTIGHHQSKGYSANATTKPRSDYYAPYNCSPDSLPIKLLWSC